MPIKIIKLKSGLCRVRTPYGIKSYATKCSRARAQARLLHGVEHGWRPSHINPEVEELAETNIPLDSIVAAAPPVYKLNYLLDEAGRRVTPAVPLQMYPMAGYNHVEFKYWGLMTYDTHIAFPRLRLTSMGGSIISGINYGIIIFGGEDSPSIRADYQHTFRQMVEVGHKGIYAHGRIFKLYRALEHLPKLPNGWEYLQFVG